MGEGSGRTDVVVIGGGMIGLCTAMLLAGDGRRVTVLERDPAPPPDGGREWDDWERRGVNQFRMLHYLLPRFRSVAEAELPQLVSALLDAGALDYDAIAELPLAITGGRRAGDERFRGVTGRRPIIEAAAARLAAATPGVELRRGSAVTGLSTDAMSAGPPHVTGVVTAAGEHIPAGLVVDAAGRRSALPDLLADAGAARPIEVRDDCGFVYYGRHFRGPDGHRPAQLGPLLQPYHSLSILTLPCDQGTWAVGLITTARDTAARVLARDDVWERLLAAFPLAAHWGEGEPLGPVQVMARIEDRQRTFVVDGMPVATGVLAVGDSWACTNPSVGRGISIGLLHAVALRDLLREVSPAERVGLARRWHELTLERVDPFVQDTLAFDRHRLGELDAAIEGREYETDDPGFALGQALAASAGRDPDQFRHFLDVAALNARGVDVLGRPGVFERALELGAPNPLPGPDRAGVLDLLAREAEPA